MVTPKVRLCNPTYQVKPELSLFQPKQITDLKGKSVVVIDNHWPVWAQTLPRLTEALMKRYGVASALIYGVPRQGPLPHEVEKAAKEADCAIFSLGLGGPEIGGLVDHAAVVAKAGLPTVCIVVEEDPNYIIWGKMMRSRKINLPSVTVPVAPLAIPVVKAMEMMDAVIDDIVNALKNPPKPQIVEISEPFIEITDSPDVIFDTMYQLDWTDGLPVIPPTEERVSKMISRVHRDAEEVIGNMPPFRGLANVWNIAVNAVMCGCLPEYMPILMAMVQACGDVDISLTIALTGGAKVTPMTIVNGPIRNELDINCSRGLMGPGKRSNATLGRALQFMLRNIGGATNSVTMPCYMSHPGRYTFCFGENEEQSPWEPLHVERGFSRETSTVTVTSVSSIIQSGPIELFVEADDWRGILTVLADSLAYFGCHTLSFGSGMAWIFITPGQANRLISNGLSKQDVKEYVWEKARVPKSEFIEKWATIRHLQDIKGQFTVVKSPDQVMVIVAGGLDVVYALAMVGSPATGGIDTLATRAVM